MLHTNCTQIFILHTNLYFCTQIYIFRGRGAEAENDESPPLFIKKVAIFFL